MLFARDETGSPSISSPEAVAASLAYFISYHTDATTHDDDLRQVFGSKLFSTFPPQLGVGVSYYGRRRGAVMGARKIKSTDDGDVFGSHPLRP